ncbi:hypothetical protein J3A83DRAFT_4085161, partial [Scleroderma citrinum]
NGQHCTCELFMPPIDPGAPYHCWECLHGFSKHPEAQSGSRSSLAVKVESKPNSNDSQQLLKVFNEWKTSSLSSNNIDPVLVDIKVGTWLLLVNVLDNQHQCAHITHASELAFQRSWTHKDVDSYVNHVFPVPMGFAATADKGKGKELKCHWKLISKEKQHYQLPSVDQLTGEDLWWYQGQTTSPIADQNVIIDIIQTSLITSITNRIYHSALHTPVPKDIYASWDPEGMLSSSDKDVSQPVQKWNLDQHAGGMLDILQ